MIIDVRHPLGNDRRLAVEGLELAPGEALVVLGPNGAGKTTLLRRLAGTLPGGPAFDAAYLPQRPVALRGTTRRNLGLGLNEVEIQRASVLSGELGIDALLDTPARSLSGGERQRMALARTLASDGEIVLLDEPLAPIDLADQGPVAAVIKRALDGRTAIVVTHDRQTAASLGDRVAVLVDGLIHQLGPPGEVLALPADEEVAAALGISNVMAGDVIEVDRGLVALDVGGLMVWGIGGPEPVGRALFGAEAVTVYAGHHPDVGSARNTWPGTVAEIRQVGHLVELLIDCGTLVAALVTPGAMVGLDLRTGDAATVAVKATAVRIL